MGTDTFVGFATKVSVPSYGNLVRLPESAAAAAQQSRDELLPAPLEVNGSWWTLVVLRLLVKQDVRLGRSLAAAHVFERAAFRHDRERHLAAHRVGELVEACQGDPALCLGTLHLLHGRARHAGARGELRLRQPERHADLAHPA